jgi:hypothetical protein
MPHEGCQDAAADAGVMADRERRDRTASGLGVTCEPRMLSLYAHQSTPTRSAACISKVVLRTGCSSLGHLQEEDLHLPGPGPTVLGT